jgi:acyl phosphate:glycerol-3-phosphate acyltransferase
MPDPISWSLALPYFSAALLIGYLCGSIPFGLLFTRAAGLGDVRLIGSGNIGATNVLRTGNKKLAALTVLADFSKGLVPVLIGQQWGPDIAVLAALGAVLGHILPLWLKFKGGKAVATYIGVLSGLYWPVALIFCVTWLSVAALSRVSSIAALVAIVATPAWLFYFEERQLVELFILLGVIIYLAHHQNIVRIIKGKETKIGQ